MKFRFFSCCIILCSLTAPFLSANSLAANVAHTALQYELWQGGNVQYRKDTSVPLAMSNAIDTAIQNWRNQTSLYMDFIDLDELDSLRIAREDILRGQGLSEVQISAQVATEGLTYPTDIPFILFEDVTTLPDLCAEWVTHTWGFSISPGNHGSIYVNSTSTDCSNLVPIIMHEIGHAVGLMHEHQRWDRDTHILVDASVENNINYMVSPGGALSAVGPFDFDSIMMYHNGSLLSGVSRTNFGYTDQLTEGDINAIKLLYGGWTQTIETAADGKCLSVPPVAGGNPNNPPRLLYYQADGPFISGLYSESTSVAISPCDWDDPAQRWVKTSNNEYINKSGLCLSSVAGSSEPVAMFCQGSAGQVWTKKDHWHGGYRMEPANQTLCLSSQYGYPWLRSCNTNSTGYDNQRWFHYITL